ncbi:hypothetical protein TKK_0010438 [Trichogramma kaykai]|uniref:Methyltransferase-like protein 4 n=1 Tax=Trichogramma kaykai TaxID=54128 RepID=A0ABD2WXN3_9HYME
MSILLTTNEGWLISHLRYLNDVYNTVKDDDKITAFRFNQAIFQINSQFLRANQVPRGNDQNGPQCSTETKKAKKRKSTQSSLPDQVLQQNRFVESVSQKIIDRAIDLQLLAKYQINDSNLQSRLESKQFYQDSSVRKFNKNFNGVNAKNCAIVANFQNERYIFPKQCQFYSLDVRQLQSMIDLSNQYDFILLDPPWWNKSIRRKKVKLEESSYDMMYNKDVADIPVGKLLKPTGIVAVWCTNAPSHIESILKEMFTAWGVEFKAKWYWLKITQNGQPVCNFNSFHGKQPYEQLIIGSKLSNVNIPDGKIIVSVPSAIHSHKPPLTEIFEEYLPDDPNCLEIFARYLLPKCTSVGLEVLKFQHLSLFEK